MPISKTVEEYRPPRKGEHLVLPEHMLSQGEDAVPLLLELLESPNLRVRIMAAQKLHQVGDERAVEPLCRVLEQYSGPASPWVKGVGRLMLLGVLAVLTALVTLVVALTMGWSLTLYRGALVIFVIDVLLVGAFLRDLFEARPMERIGRGWRNTVASFGGHDLLVRATVDALAAIAVRCPSAAVGQSLPVLRKVTADGLRHRKGTREAAARAVARVQVSSAALRRLPVVSAEPRISMSDLPVPAGFEERDDTV